MSATGPRDAAQIHAVHAGFVRRTMSALLAAPDGTWPKFLVTVDRDEDGVWVAECPAIPGCVSQGGTRGEAAESIREAIVLCP